MAEGESLRFPALQKSVNQCIEEQKQTNVTNRMAKFQLWEVWVEGIPQFSSKITPKKLFPFILEQSLCWLQIFLWILKFDVLDLARFEDHTLAFFKGKC